MELKRIKSMETIIQKLTQLTQWLHRKCKRKDGKNCSSVNNETDIVKVCKVNINCVDEDQDECQNLAECLPESLKNPVSRHMSVSRSGRYKERQRKRLALFDNPKLIHDNLKVLLEERETSVNMEPESISLPTT